MTNELKTAPVPFEVPARAIATAFVDSLSRRDFDGMAGCLAADVRFRALLPPRDVDVTGPEATLAEFRRWFGDESQRLELVDSTVGELGDRVYMRWLIRMSSADTGASRLVEQHVFSTAGDRIKTLSLLCSGFVAG